MIPRVRLGVVMIMATLLFICITGCTGERPPGKNLSQKVPVTAIHNYSERQGELLFRKYCSVCHGTEGKGDGFNAYNLDPRPRDLSDPVYMRAYSRQRLTEVIMQGGRGINKSPLMPAWGNTLRDYQVEYLVDYLWLLTKNDAGPEE